MVPWMLEALAAAAGTTTHRFTTSKSHWAHGHGELSLGRSADPRRFAEARVHRLRTHRVAVYARPNEGTVAELAYVPRERVRPSWRSPRRLGAVQEQAGQNSENFLPYDGCPGVDFPATKSGG